MSVVSSNPSTPREAVGGWAQGAAKNAGWLTVLGVVTVIAGCIAVASPLGAGLGVALLIGVALVVGGIARTIGAFRAGLFGQGTLAFIGGMVALVAGVIITARPRTRTRDTDPDARGVPRDRRRLERDPRVSRPSAERLGWMLVSAILGVVLGFMLLQEWPFSGVWAVGMLVGLNLVFSGFSIIAIGSAARGLAKRLTSVTS